MTLTNQLLMRIADSLSAQTARLDTLGGVKPGAVHPVPRPLTGLAQARERIERKQLQELTSEVYEAMSRWGGGHSG